MTPLEGFANFFEHCHFSFLLRIRGVQATPPKPGNCQTEHDAIPENAEP
ncbi:hypothetical protein BLL52_2338 [Rhodoferax antarcticus ANT.BR]|uniref:Uncharacterized protein n=1 Tax=Rhodoferax antarcticus ANT.BR TaxID=1111071 RepID=A0A1Q8YDI3_9BURK|nr:hypothetical protein BLL52_2338 [Rhodoferax antarcticus ANT.BR]